jgi:uncharacterized protein (TIGR03435 family)
MGLAAVCCSFAQSQPSPPAFEIASLKLSPKGNSGTTYFSPYGTDRFTITNAPPDVLLQLAFGVLPYQISGAPKWFESERYDLTARAEDDVKLTARELQPRLQRLLAERLRLAVHRERKEFAGFALVVSKDGPKLKESTAEATEQGTIFPGGMRLPGATMDWLASMLSNPVGRPVVNQTGIAGSYDIDLSYAKESDARSSLPSLFTTLEQRLGLKLEAHTVTVEMLTIDRIERVPVEN